MPGYMNPKETTLSGFIDEHRISLVNAFPEKYGRWLTESHFDPSFTRSDLKKLAKRGYIQLDMSDNKNWRYRLTMKATNYKSRYFKD